MDMQNWNGNDSLAAFVTSKGHMIVERRGDVTLYTLMDDDYYIKTEGALPQPKADVEEVARLLCEEREATLIGREPAMEAMNLMVARNF